MAARSGGGWLHLVRRRERPVLDDRGPSARLRRPGWLVLPGAFQLAVACLSDESMILDAFRTGGGVAWGEHHPDVFTGCERFYRPGYVANLVSSWIPAVADLRERLVAGIPVADVGCGLGASTRIPGRHLSG